MQRKGQAAMEFLMTYGWAILAAIIAIGVLAYFGVFTPGKYVPTATVLNAPFTAVGAVADASNSEVSIEIRNGLGETIKINSVSLTGADSGGCTAFSTQTDVASGDTTVAVLTLCTLTAGETIKGDIEIRYVKSGTTLELTSTGTMTERIVA